MDLSKNLKKYRKEKELTQKELAQKIGVSTITIQNYENNRREPNINTLKEIAKALGVPINDLLKDNELERKKFKEDFDINIFEPRVMKYINDLKQNLANIFPGVEINNTLVLQNIIINIMAKDSARSAAGMFKPSILLSEFQTGDGRLLTGEELFDTLYSNYYEKYKKERVRILGKRVSFIINERINDTLTDKEMDILKEYYKEFPKDKIPNEVLRIIENIK